jgi:hypothetical protein
MKRRKRKIKRRRKRVVVCLVLMTLMAMGVVCVGVMANSYTSSDSSSSLAESEDDITGSGTVKLRDGEKLDEDALKPIVAYFEAYFQSMANLKSTDITTLFADPSSENAWINQTAMDYLIELRQNQANDLHMTAYECGLTITAVNEDSNTLEVSLLEDHTVNFAFISDIDSSSSGISHTFYLKKTGAGYVITKHQKEEDSFIMLEEAVADSYDDPDSVAAEILDQSISIVADLADEKEAFNSGDWTADDPTADRDYNGQAAVNYAMKWVDSREVVRNTKQFGVYDSYGGNCNNYISQCLYAGGIPMDCLGDVDTQWKWYGEDVNLDETKQGRSPAWTGVEEFYTYASENSGYGLVAAVDDNVYSGSVGDVLQYGQNGEWLHSVIITRVVKDQSGKVEDYLINSNTTDRSNYPASAYGYSELRLIKILGWNQES